MTDDPAHDYDVYCAQQDAEEDPDCEECGGLGSDVLLSRDTCESCGGSGRERDAVKRHASKQYADDMVRWAEKWGPVLCDDWESGGEERK